MFANDTVRLVVQFRDFNGNPITPDEVKLTIYDENQVAIEVITTGITDNYQGNYHFDYVAPEHDFICEFSGLWNGKPVLAREFVHVQFAK